MNVVDNLNSVKVINKPCMSSRNMRLLSWATLRSDSEQGVPLIKKKYKWKIQWPGSTKPSTAGSDSFRLYFPLIGTALVYLLTIQLPHIITVPLIPPFFSLFNFVHISLNILYRQKKKIWKRTLTGKMNKSKTSWITSFLSRRRTEKGMRISHK